MKWQIVVNKREKGRWNCRTNQTLCDRSTIILSYLDGL